MMMGAGAPGSETPNPPEHSPGDRRGFPRAKVPTAVEYRVTGELGSEWLLGVLVDLNARGLQFTGERRFETGTRLDVQLPLENRSEPYGFSGEIVWTREERSGLTEYGMQFIDVTPDQQFEIDELARFLMQPPHPKGS